jgi:hypothetical protein
MVNNTSYINTTNNHLLLQIIEHEKTTTFDVGLEQAHICGGVQPVKGIAISINIWISNDNEDMKKKRQNNLHRFVLIANWTFSLYVRWTMF